MSETGTGPDGSAAAGDPVVDRFERIVGLPENEWAAALERECGGDATLRAQVQALLDHLRAPLPLLAALTQRLGDAAAAAADLALVPSRIGEFQILGRIGRGGMGVVYLAEQERPRRRVALKVLLPFQADPQSVRRLVREAEVLGRLHHPGIAEIYAAGTFSSPLGEQPYFAMELVAGVELLAFCDQQQLDLRARCEVLARIADAVHHAHERGVVHRDLKPANILVVRLGPDAIQPKVLDFGIARCADLGPDAAKLTTQSGLVVGTLDYMSPEQYLAGRVDVRSDVYALGVMLYELVAARRPFDFVNRSMQEIGRMLLEVDPPALPAQGAGGEDLQTIASRALAKDAAERYGSAAELAAELRRYLAHEPIHARPLTLRYQLRKFARRHRPLVLGLVATLVTMVAGTILSLWFALAAKSESQRAQRREYAAQLMIANTSTELDPLAARAALEQVRDRAGFEWHVVDARLRQSWLGSEAPRGDRSTVALLTDGRALHLHVGTAAGTANAVVLRDARDGKELRRWRAPGPLALPAIAGTGTRVAAVTNAVENEVAVWDVAADAPVLQTRIRAFAVHQLELSADGRFLLVVIENDREQKPHRECVVIDIANGAQRRHAGNGTVRAEASGDGFWFGADQRLAAAAGAVLPRHPQVAEPAWHSQSSADGQWLCTTQRDHRNIKVVDADGKVLHLLPGHRAEPRHLAMHDERRLLASCTDVDGTIMLWDLPGGRLLRTFAVPASRVAFAADGRKLLAATANGAQWVDLEARFARAHDTDYITSGDLDPTGRLLATGNTSCELRLWDLESMQCIGRLHLAATPGEPVPEGAEIECVAFDPAGQRVHCSVQRRRGPRTSGIVTVDLASWAMMESRDWPEVEPDKLVSREKWGRLPQRHSHWSALTTPGGWYVESRTSWSKGHYLNSALEVTAPDGTVHSVPLPPIADDDTLAELRLQLSASLGWRGHAPAAVAPSGQRVAFGLLDGSFAVLDLDGLQWVVRRRGHLGPITAIEFLPDGSRLCTGGNDMTVRFWDTDSWEEMLREQRHSRGVERLLAAPDGQRLWSLSADRTIVAWDTEPEFERQRRLAATNADRTAANAFVDQLWSELGDGARVADRIRSAITADDARWAWVLQRQIERLGGNR